MLMVEIWVYCAPPPLKNVDALKFYNCQFWAPSFSILDPATGYLTLTNNPHNNVASDICVDIYSLDSKRLKGAIRISKQEY